MSLVGLVSDVHGALSAAGLDHAFGGALALAYVADPRGTVDVDVNVFVSTEEVDTVLGALGALGLQAERRRDQWLPLAGIRLRQAHGGYPVDLFLSLDERYGEIQRRCVSHPFGPDHIPLPFLSAEDLALFKLSFGRAKDWVDLRSIAFFRPGLDIDYIERQLVALRGSGMYPRVARLRNLLRGTHPRTGDT
ncbi:MAG: hypothetical protein ACR2HM_09705 [Acidimicrobiales bacterium]